jgi:type II secretory pathway component GspD/PulD (secretin)
VSEGLAKGAKPQAAGRGNARRSPVRQTAPNTRHLYTLRVVEQPVRAVLQEFSQRLGWQIEIDEQTIRAAGRSVEKRVSFAVEKVGQDELLEALLRPAGLGFVREGERIKIVPRQ